MLTLNARMELNSFGDADMTTELDQLAAFVARAQYDDLSVDARQQLKIRVLDSLGCAIGALDGEPIGAIRAQLNDFGSKPLCSLIGGEQTAPDRAAFYNGALVRYLDYMDSYLAKDETCHPSDNLAAILAAAEYADAPGETFLTALAVAYQVHARLSDEAPVRDRGFDHTTQGAYAVGAGVAKALGLDAIRTANAIALSGVGNVALRVTRTGELSQWKGLAYPNTAFIGTHAVFLAMRGITGPAEVFEGNKGFKESISGPYRIDWESENLERVTRTIVKKYNAEIHAQSTIEGTLELRELHGFGGDAVARVEIDIFDVAHKIIGGGEEGDKTIVRTKEQADHSLQYMVAVALCDGELLPAQYAPQRILAPDVQSLLRRVAVRPDADFSARFPEEMACRVSITFHDGRRFEIEKQDYEGFHTRPMSWASVAAKFHRLAKPYANAEVERTIVDTVGRLDKLRVRDLTRLLASVGANDRP
jgi:2-methylcitrate dehydratase